MRPEQGPQNFKFGGGVSETVLHPAVLVLVLIAGILICVSPRRRALAAFLSASLLIPVDQVLLIGPAHFPMLRILVLFGIVRMMRERAASKLRIFSGGLKSLDAAVLLLAVFIALNGILLFQVSGAIINQVGELYTVVGVYFLLRFLIRNEEDVISAIQTLVVIAVVVASVMTYEVTTGHNPYALLGGAEASKSQRGLLVLFCCLYLWLYGGRGKNIIESRLPESLRQLSSPWLVIPAPRLLLMQPAYWRCACGR